VLAVALAGAPGAVLLLGLPYRGQSPGPLRDEEYDDLPVEYDFFCDTFRTWVPEDMEKYREVRDKIINNLYTLVEQLPAEYDKEHGGWRIFLGWCAGFHTAPAPRGFYRD
jgi:hypothetical protein